MENNLENGEKTNALDALDQILTKDPNNYEILSLYALICVEEGLWQRGVNPAVRAAALQPDDTSYLMLGQVYGGGQNFPKAIEALAKAVVANPQNEAAREFLGMAYFENGQIEEARKVQRELEQYDKIAARRLLKTIQGELAVQR